MKPAGVALVLVLSVALPDVAMGAKEPAKKEPLVCTYEATTGSHLKRRVCMTPSERKARQLADQQRASELQNREFRTNIRD